MTPTNPFVKSLIVILLLCAIVAIFAVLPTGSAEARLLTQKDCKNEKSTPVKCTSTPENTEKPTKKPTSTQASDTPKPTVLNPTATPTATPTVTFTPTFSPTPTPTFEFPEPLEGGDSCGDIWIQPQGIEVTQGIQVYPGNPIPLISFKRTVVRVYVQSIQCGDEPWRASARLTVMSGPYSGDILLPVTNNARGRITVPTAGSNRQILSESFNFILPVWLTFTGERDLQAAIFSTDLRAENPDNNQMSIHVQFRAASSRSTYAVPHGNCAAPSGVTLPLGSPVIGTAVIDAAHPFSELLQARLFVENLMPTYAFFLSPLPGSPTPCFATTAGVRSDQHANNWAIPAIDRVCPEGGCFIYVNNPVVPAGTGQGGWCCNRTPLGNTVYNGIPEVGSNAGSIMGQEFFHSFIRLNLHTFDPAFGFPWSDNTIGRQVGLRTSGGSGIAGLEIRGPRQGDVMSYNGAPTWISPFTYCLLLEAMDSITCPPGAATSGLDMPLLLKVSKGLAALNLASQETNFLFVTGLVASDGGLTIEPLRIINTDRDLTSLSEAGPYTLLMQEIDGNILAEYDFSLSPGTVHPGQHVESIPFALTVPYPELTARVLISHDGVLQAELSRSLSAPVVSLLSPNVAGELSGMQMVSWEGTDADEGSLLFYDLDYSPDGGETWLPLGSYIAETTLEVNFDAVPGGDDVVLRVVASDGWNTSEDISAVAFNVPKHSPEITFLEPLDGATFYETQPFYAEAIAFDWEDGPISDLENVTWLSDIDGVLSNGPWAALSEMTPGYHTLTVEVTDSDGNISEASVHIHIMEVEDEDQTQAPENPASPPDNTVLFIAVGLAVLVVAFLVIIRSRSIRTSKKR